ncbi:hypothetical protein BX616_007179 [Lobosporangium transversale]|uniref:Uncharacterized protein n=1 Tax=Lobosporangium transversale TaxID=64571 RepID=A0A1Y2GR12_9FUNG|nr:hypothetical protein BCR41DRAFT_352141 [Lobosporangium transversale]KAF9914970.1 hypothetical protein BX616_007179 [Lobosporangium transversale]ORZ18286.1 hypothetical protein BCR41DRAFT_352141 [Lobosporangium transversale]|eukprot:XP_021882081.1 hypothetical protein BCR41DRAFT_352141 [Lobosporangium transversale]
MTAQEGLQIEISGIPAENGKCRVETQLKITLRLKDAHGEIVKDWKQLRLPRPLIAKEKHRMEKFNGRSKHVQDSEILTLDAKLVCDHDRTKILECCDNCIGRERKRAHRRKESQKLPGPLSSIPIFGSVNSKNSAASLDNEANPPTPTDPIEYQQWERNRIMVFSSTEYVDISLGECLLPTRITCYCRHHNEKVGFRIQFTAKDSAGVTLATVLTNPVMMMDDHKSGKRNSIAQSKGLGVASTTNGVKKSKLGAKSISKPQDVSNKQDSLDQGLQHQDGEEDDDQEDMDEEEEDALKGPEEIDLEAGHHIPAHDFPEQNSKFEDSEILSGDILTPLASTIGGAGAKRRVDENMMEDVQLSSHSDGLRGPFRRKTSHDVTSTTEPSSLFSSSGLGFASTTMLSSQSPFMPGSPFAKEEQDNVFTPSFSQALGQDSFLDQRNIDMYLHRTIGSIPRRQSKDSGEHDSSMMEFTTLDESMSSPPESFPTSTLSNGSTSAGKTGQSHEPTSLSNTSQASVTQASTSVPVSDYSQGPITTPAVSSTGSNPFNSGMFSSAFGSTLQTSSTQSRTTAPGMSSSFLDASQMQEFQNFKRQSLLQQKQQQILLQLQQGIQQQSQRQMETKPVPWTIPKGNNADPYLNMRIAMSQTTDPLSSAFIPSSTSSSEDNKKDATTTDDDANGALSSTTPITATSIESSLAPKKRGRPRKSTATLPTSEANSPVLSPKTPVDTPRSPSPASAAPAAPAAPLSASAAAAAAAAQYALFQQQQQQQLQRHQQQLQQQQKQAILARQRPRVQKVIPSRGSVEGDTEITLLGSGFYPGIVPTFDGVPALNVQYYGPETVICRLPPRSFPGTVIVKAQNQLSALTSVSNPGLIVPGLGLGKDDANSSDLVRTMSQLFGGPSTVQSSGILDDDVGVLFEYEESKGDRDLMALALQVLSLKMNGRVEPPHQIAMRIMGTAAASNSLMGPSSVGQIGGASQSQLQLQSQQPLAQQQQSLLGFGGLQPNALSQQLQPQAQAQLQSSGIGSLAIQNPTLTNGSILGTGMLGFNNFMNSMGGSNGSSGL